MIHASMQQYKVLVVDDSKTYLLFATNALTDAGYTVLVAEDIWVSRIIREQQPNLILMDVSLGASKGTNAVTALRKCQFSDGIKIYLHSSEKSEKLAELTRECGADGYIVKDGSESNLAKKVTSAFGNIRSAKSCNV